MPTFADWVSLPENRSAERAVRRVADALRRGRVRPALNPLVLHGPAGVGKSHLALALVARLQQTAPDRTVTLLAARALLAQPDGPQAPSDTDLTIIEDLQPLPDLAVASFALLVDRCRTSDRQLVATSAVGPARLTHLPHRLTTRLCG